MYLEQRTPILVFFPNAPRAFPAGLQAPTLQGKKLPFFSDFRILNQPTLLYMLLTNAVDLPADGIQKNQSAPLLLKTSHKGKGVKGPTQQKVS